MSNNTVPDLGWAALYGLEAYSPERPAVTEGPCAHPTFPEVRGRLIAQKGGCVWLLTSNGVTPAPADGLCFVDPAAADARLAALTT